MCLDPDPKIRDFIEQNNGPTSDGHNFFDMGRQELKLQESKEHSERSRSLKFQRLITLLSWGESSSAGTKFFQGRKIQVFLCIFSFFRVCAKERWTGPAIHGLLRSPSRPASRSFSAKTFQKAEAQKTLRPREENAQQETHCTQRRLGRVCAPLDSKKIEKNPGEFFRG